MPDYSQIAANVDRGLAGSQRPNVLVVDDDPAVCSSLKFSLELEGFEVRTFGGGGELLSATDLPRSGCLVIDYHMPTINGLEVHRRLREQGNSMPAILTTTAPDPALIDDQAIATLTFINGVMMTFVAGQPIVDSAEHLDRLIQGVIAGVAQIRLG